MVAIVFVFVLNSFTSVCVFVPECLGVKVKESSNANTPYRKKGVNRKKYHLKQQQFKWPPLAPLQIYGWSHTPLFFINLDVMIVPSDS